MHTPQRATELGSASEHQVFLRRTHSDNLPGRTLYLLTLYKQEVSNGPLYCSLQTGTALLLNTIQMQLVRVVASVCNCLRPMFVHV